MNPLLEIRSSWFLVCTDSALSRRFMGLHNTNNDCFELLHCRSSTLRSFSRCLDILHAASREPHSLSNFLLAFLRISGFSLSCGSNYSQSSSIVELRFRLVVAWILVSLLPDYKYPIVIISFSKVNFVDPFQEFDTCLLESDIPVIVNSLLLQHIQINMGTVPPENISELIPWARKIEFESCK